MRGRAFVDLRTGSLLISAVLVIVSGNRCHNPEDIELFNKTNPSQYNCWSRYDCQDGYERSVKLGSVHPMGTDIQCNVCPEGSFSNFWTKGKCMKCTPCGNRKELSNCSVIRDRVCSSSECISNKFYLNTTDNQCYPCSVCCGSSSKNVVLECLRSGALSAGVTVIGKQGATHCGIKSSQQCDDLNFTQKSNKTEQSNGTVIQDKVHSSECISNKFYLNTTDNKCYLCSVCCGSSSKNIVPECLRSGALHAGVTVIGQQGLTHCGVRSSQQCDDLIFTQENNKDGSLSLLVIVIILSILLIISVGAHFKRCIKRRRSSQRLYHCAFCCCLNSCYALLSQGDGCGELNPCFLPFQEKLKLIPENVMIKDIPYEVEELTYALDANQPLSKNWYHVGRKLGVSRSDLDLVKREDGREGGSPTNVLLSVLRAKDNISLRAFVKATHDIGRNDIANNIIEFYRSQQGNSETTSTV
ncbi:uncharacterized protein [Montipora foliosa]|uniref:uncharacterized protein isoform X1 n=1 Tax=Montipora foliosa TaxID=591990 RepID=UPI0035F1FA0D